MKKPNGYDGGEKLFFEKALLERCVCVWNYYHNNLSE